MTALSILRTLVKASPVVIMAARKAWPYIAQAIQQNPQIAVTAKNRLATFSGKHRKATVADIELRLAALTVHVESMNDEPGAVAVAGSDAVTRGEALSRIAQIDAAVHSLNALTEKARPAALRRISYELDRLATQVLIPRS